MILVRPWLPFLRLACVACLCTGVSCAKAEFEPDDGGAQPAPDLRNAEPQVCPENPIAGCSSANLDPCDPVCQTGTACDWCTQKCSYTYGTSGNPEPTCVSNDNADKSLYQGCTVDNLATGKQTDDCAAGSICLTLSGDPRQCFTLCHDAIDCPGPGECVPSPLPGGMGQVSVCDPPPVQCGSGSACCNPVAQTGCDDGRHCFLVSESAQGGHSRTVCEFAYGEGGSNASTGADCTYTRDCFLKFTCVDGTCRQVCDSASCCAQGTTFVARGSEYGYCK